jgi:hypothetical protein
MNCKHVMRALALAALTSATAADAFANTPPFTRVMPDQETYSGRSMVVWGDVKDPDYEYGAAPSIYGVPVETSFDPYQWTGPAGMRVNLPFTFPFYGEARTSVWISPMGFVSLVPQDPPYWQVQNAAWYTAQAKRFPTQAGEQQYDGSCFEWSQLTMPEMIAGYWSALMSRSEDDHPAPEQVHGRIYYMTALADGTPLVENGRRYVVITYEDLAHAGTNWWNGSQHGHHTFQIVLFDDGEIELNYSRLERFPRNYCYFYAHERATIGVNQGDGWRGTEIFHSSYYAGDQGTLPGAGTSLKLSLSGDQYGYETIPSRFRTNETFAPPDPDQEKLFYTWDFGDGTIETGEVGDPRMITTRHTYTGIGQEYVATLSVEDRFEISSASVTIRVGDPENLDTRVNVAIQDHLRFIYTQAKAVDDDKVKFKGQYSTAATGMALLSYCNQGFAPSGDASRHPYVEIARKARSYLLSILEPIPWFQPDAGGNPDTNGNGLGFYHNKDGHDTYINGIIVMALIGTLEPDLPVEMHDLSGNLIPGYTLRDLIQDCVDGIAWGQSEWNGSYEGGWHYSPNSGSADGSTNQWPCIALYEAERNGFGATVPSFVKTRMPSWLDYSQPMEGQNDPCWPNWTPDCWACSEWDDYCRQHWQEWYGAGISSRLLGGFQYSGGSWDSWITMGKTGGGLVGNLVIGRDAPHPRVAAAFDFVARNWYDNGVWQGPGLYDIYSLAKGLRVWEKSDLTFADGNRLKWYPDLADHLVNERINLDDPNYDGSAGTDWSGSLTMGAAYCVLTLTQSVVGLPPVADACGGLCAGETHDRRRAIPAFQTISLDAGLSRHQDADRSIVLYEWDVDGDGVYGATVVDDAATAST